MVLPRKKFREVLFQILFCKNFDSSQDEELIAFMMREMKITKKVIKEALEQAVLIREKEEKFDDLLTNSSLEYGVNRIPKAERTIFHLALYELFFQPALPPNVVLSEAIRLTRKYATRDSARFVNAILDAIYKLEFPKFLA